MSEEQFDWTKNGDVAALIGTQLMVGIAGLVDQGWDETELINRFMSGRYGFGVTKYGVQVHPIELKGKDNDNPDRA